MADDPTLGTSKRQASGKASTISATYEQIQQWIDEAKKLPDKPERKKDQIFKGKDVVELLYDVVTDLRSKGYTFEEIVAICKTQDGIPVAKAETFKAYYNRIDKERAKTADEASKKRMSKTATTKARVQPKADAPAGRDAPPLSATSKPAVQTETKPAVQGSHNPETATAGLKTFDVSRLPRG